MVKCVEEILLTCQWQVYNGILFWSFMILLNWMTCKLDMMSSRDQSIAFSFFLIFRDFNLFLQLTYKWFRPKCFYHASRLIWKHWTIIVASWNTFFLLFILSTIFLAFHFLFFHYRVLTIQLLSILLSLLLYCLLLFRRILWHSSHSAFLKRISRLSF